MVFSEKMPWQTAALSEQETAQSTVNTNNNDNKSYCTFDPLIPRAVTFQGRLPHDLEACCPQCSAYKRRRATRSERGWCAGCFFFLFKVVALVGLIVLISRVFHVGQGKHWKFMDVTEGASGWPYASGQDVQKISCDEERVCSKTFKFAKVDDFALRNLIKPNSGCIRDGNSEWNNIQILEGSQSEDVVVDFSFNVTNVETQQLLDIEQTDNSLSFNFPTSDPRIPPTCSGRFSSWTKIYVRKGLRLDKLFVESLVFSVEIPQPVDIQVSDAEVKLSAGVLNAHPFPDSQVVSVSTDSGSISGTFLLYDQVKITAVAGSINADVIPQKNADSGNAAVLQLETQAGQINAQFPPKNVTKIPERQYLTTVTSGAGSVSGRYLHGDTTTIQTGFGSIDVVLLPLASSSKNSLVTSTKSGMQRVKLLSPVNGSTAALDKLDASHTSIYGGVSIVYPTEWQGTVTAETTAGSASMNGEGLEVTEEKKGLGVSLTGTKGSGQGFSRCSTQFGRVNFEIGTGEDL
jgi:hypothetical protein